MFVCVTLCRWPLVASLTSRPFCLFFSVSFRKLSPFRCMSPMLSWAGCSWPASVFEQSSNIVTNAQCGSSFSASCSGTVFATGFSYLQFVDLNSPRNLFVIGFSLYWGIAFREYIKGFGLEQPFSTGELLIRYWLKQACCPGENFFCRFP